MSGIADIVWRGFGTWSTVAKVPTRGYVVSSHVPTVTLCYATGYEGFDYSTISDALDYQAGYDGLDYDGKGDC